MQPRTFYQEWPINVDVEGTYHNLGLFFDRVGRLSRLVNVGNLQGQDARTSRAFEHDPRLLRRHDLRLRGGAARRPPGRAAGEAADEEPTS